MTISKESRRCKACKHWDQSSACIIPNWSKCNPLSGLMGKDMFMAPDAGEGCFAWEASSDTLAAFEADDDPDRPLEDDEFQCG